MVTTLVILFKGERDLVVIFLVAHQSHPNAAMLSFLIHLIKLQESFFIYLQTHIHSSCT